MKKKGDKIDNENVVLLDKEVGETPLACLERFRVQQIAKGGENATQFNDISMTYAGRLDPLASGKLLILIGEECKKKEQYLGLDKEYEVEVLFGVTTDTGDVLGLIESVDVSESPESNFSKNEFLRLFVGKFTQKYPAYSSKTVDGKQLHNLARAGELPDEMPTKEVAIYSIEELGKAEINAQKLAEKAIEVVSKVNGDFRQQEIIEGWNTFSEKYGNHNFSIFKLRVNCSSGTYMRLLAERIGKVMGVGALALSIHRTKILVLSRFGEFDTTYGQC